VLSFLEASLKKLPFFCLHLHHFAPTEPMRGMKDARPQPDIVSCGIVAPLDCGPSPIEISSAAQVIFTQALLLLTCLRFLALF
jgi:hypothetical protein